MRENATPTRKSGAPAAANAPPLALARQLNGVLGQAELNAFLEAYLEGQDNQP